MRGACFNDIYLMTNQSLFFNFFQILTLTVMDYTQSVHISISDLEHAQITLSKDFDTPFGHILCSFSLYRYSLEMISCTEQQGMYNALDSFKSCSSFPYCLQMLHR